MGSDAQDRVVLSSQAQERSLPKCRPNRGNYNLAQGRARPFGSHSGAQNHQHPVASRENRAATSSAKVWILAFNRRRNGVYPNAAPSGVTAMWPRAERSAARDGCQLPWKP